MKFYRMEHYRNEDNREAVYSEEEMLEIFASLSAYERRGRAFARYVLDCTDKNGFLEEIEVRIGGNECIGYSVEIIRRMDGATTRETIKRRAYGGFYHTVAFGKLETAETVKAKVEKLFADGYSVETVTKHFFEL